MDASVSTFVEQMKETFCLENSLFRCKFRSIEIDSEESMDELS